MPFNLNQPASMKAGAIQPESVNSPQMSVFQHYYEACLEHGDSLAWYA